MKNQLSIAIALLIASYLCAQDFIWAEPPAPFKSVHLGDADYSDIDGDGDLDVIITGLHEGIVHTSLYINNGDASFGFTSTGISAVFDGDLEFADIDGDGDEDLVLRGEKFFVGMSTLEVYTNDGNGNFSLASSEEIPMKDSGSLRLEDLDGDNDLDLILNGVSINNQLFVEIRINDGNGNFEHDSDNNLAGTGQGSLLVADFNGDDSKDIFLFGGGTLEFFDQDPAAILYLNDGSGKFSSTPTTVEKGIGTAKIADLDGDDDIDIFFSGAIENGPLSTEVYFNDGEANFTKDTNNSFKTFQWLSSRAEIFDADNDNDPDILISGLSGSGLGNDQELYLNDGQGIFTQASTQQFGFVDSGKILALDVDGDNDQDLIMGGSDLFGLTYTALILNQATVSNNEVNLNTETIVISPNPTSGDLVQVDHSDINQNILSISVVDNYGQVVATLPRQFYLSQYVSTIDISHVPSGVYYIQIEGTEKILVEKFVRR